MTNYEHYVGEEGTTLLVNTGVDITSATTTNLYVIKPDGTASEWVGSATDTTYITYTIVEDDFDQAGVYLIKSYVVVGDWSGYGNEASLAIYEV